MVQQDTKIFFSILRSAISGEPMTESEKSAFPIELVPEFFSLAKSHDITQILAVGIEQNGLPGGENIEKELIKAVYRYEQLNYTHEKLCEELENAKVPFIPLKGSIMRKYYRNPWMRTSCDIDVLVHEEDLDRAVYYLTQNCEYTAEKKQMHDFSLYSPNKIHIELHYKLLDDGSAKESDDVLKTVWTTSVKHESHQYWREMPDEMFYFYHIVHMAKHFEFGGCGVRPFADLWILDNMEDSDKQKRDELLKQGNLLQFADCARQLSRVWFANADHSAITMQMENYILSGGVYGSYENFIKVQQRKKGGKTKLLLSRLFLPYDQIKFKYPILQKHRWLLPIMQVRRWFSLLTPKDIRRFWRVVKCNNDVYAETAEQAENFMKNVGL